MYIPLCEEYILLGRFIRISFIFSMAFVLEKILCFLSLFLFQLDDVNCTRFINEYIFIYEQLFQCAILWNKS